MSPARVSSRRLLRLTDAQAAALAGRPDGSAVPQEIAAAAVAAIRAHAITATEIAAQCRVATSAVAAWCHGKSRGTNKPRLAPIAPAASFEVIDEGGTEHVRDRTSDAAARRRKAAAAAEAAAPAPAPAAPAAHPEMQAEAAAAADPGAILHPEVQQPDPPRVRALLDAALAALGLTPHPLAGLLPMLAEDEFAGLVEDVRRHGVRQPVIVSR